MTSLLQCLLYALYRLTSTYFFRSLCVPSQESRLACLRKHKPHSAFHHPREHGHCSPDLTSPFPRLITILVLNIFHLQCLTSWVNRRISILLHPLGTVDHQLYHRKCINIHDHPFRHDNQAYRRQAREEVMAREIKMMTGSRPVRLRTQQEA